MLLIGKESCGCHPKRTNSLPPHACFFPSKWNVLTLSSVDLQKLTSTFRKFLRRHQGIYFSDSDSLQPSVLADLWKDRWWYPLGGNSTQCSHLGYRNSKLRLSEHPSPYALLLHVSLSLSNYHLFQRQELVFMPSSEGSQSLAATGRDLLNK